MYKSKEFKKIVSYRGCVCSNQEFQDEFLSNIDEYPVKINK